MYYSIYMSSASNPLPDAELMNIKAKSNTDAAKSGVTGLLVFHRNHFIHYYEGEKTNVNKMLAALVRDKRHKDVRMVSEGKLRERQFQDQSMELRVLDKDPLFTANELSEDGVGVRKIINDCFMKIT